jgi:uncharacterized protein (TIGR03790 family)
MIKLTVSFILSAAIFLAASTGWALQPHEILVIANKNAARSVGLAKYYMQRRGIPKDNLLQLWLTDQELCTRDAYDRKVAKRVRGYLRENDKQRRIRCLLVMYGVPLKVAPPKMSPAEKAQVDALRKQQAKLTQELKRRADSDKERAQALRNELKTIGQRITQISRTNERSSLDSELALVLEESYDLDGWMPNPLFVGFKNKKELPIDQQKVLLVSRLDAASDAIVKKIINDSIASENQGLRGKAYFDARWPRPTGKPAKNAGLDYSFYDRSIYAAAERVAQSGLMPVVVDEKKELFQPGEAPQAALYCGWYSLGRYVDAFKWKPGAVGYHIASSECTTLKGAKSQVWCKRMLEEGAAATIGPTSEPYVQAFPIPEIFFAALLDGRLTLAECYAVSKPFWSWQMVLIGDPLYRPFKARP